MEIPMFTSKGQSEGSYVVIGMPEEEYRKDPAVNKSTLWEMRKSPAHYKYALDHPQPDTPALKFGRALHMAVLEPDAYSKHYAVGIDADRRTKAGREQWDAFQAANADREIISSADHDVIVEMYSAVWNAAGKLLNKTGREIPAFWRDPDTGIKCKCRWDAIDNRLNCYKVIDLKTCADASTEAFTKDALKYGYDVQAAHYLRGFRAVYGKKKVDFYFVCIEKTPPYAVNVIKASDSFIERGTWILMDLMNKLGECRKTDAWPSYGNNELVLPEWAVIPE